MDGVTMSRIRSIHPGIWTDEGFMSVSAHARLLLIGIWTEAFDDGIFEWKPLTLKARIFPVDNVDINELLLELFHAGFIGRLESHPRKPGAIRNFQKFQRPKKPNSSGMLSDEWLDFVGAKSSPVDHDDDGSEPVRNQYGTDGGKPPQMEDGGGNGSSSLRSELFEKETRERGEFSDWFNSWPSAASDNDDDAFSAWLDLSEADRSEASKQSSAYVDAAKGGGRTAICSAANYLRKRMWTRLAKLKPPDKPAPKAIGLSHLQKPQSREEYLAAEKARSERSFR